MSLRIERLLDETGWRLLEALGLERGLEAFVAGLPEVLECHHVTGSDRFVLRVAVGRWGTPPTFIILSSPVAPRARARGPAR